MMPAPIRRLNQNRRNRINLMFNARDDAIIVSNNTITTASLCVLGPPISQGRIKCHRNAVSGRLVVFDPTHDEKFAFKRVVRTALVGVGATLPLFDNGVKLKVTATFYVADVRKDVDNLLKFLLDSLESVIYNNDKMIYTVVATKITTNNNFERTEFMVENISEG
jgi:Holliday junction resolvase RusA-like endonuclease